MMALVSGRAVTTSQQDDDGELGLALVSVVVYVARDDLKRRCAHGVAIFGRNNKSGRPVDRLLRVSS